MIAMDQAMRNANIREYATAISAERPIVEKRKMIVASLVPRPKIDIGRTATKVDIATTDAMNKGDASIEKASERM